MSGGGAGEGTHEKHIAESGLVFVTMQHLDSDICNLKSLLVVVLFPLNSPLKRPQVALLVHGLYEGYSTFTRQELHAPAQEEIIQLLGFLGSATYFSCAPCVCLTALLSSDSH